MKKNVRISILSIFIVITIFIIIRQSTIIYFQIKNINIPNKENRQIRDMSTHKWITVKKLSKRYNMAEEAIFKTLEITPSSGDENLYVKDLADKYNKTPDEMKINLKKIIESDKNIENDINIEGKKNE
ncbi:hypothetical protein [Clostridium lacusfryxellense]|uniref:hypothetical protein n=1 Tax=Clostridium lacusfryxellense TaxID=205328 RepID=UPI001C0AA48D|nr:hypothetical protein [Clostridium lacusfryxellense]MBU3113535.1 hypothetical protein [Clostridium lacusfryxellense]